ncbi:Uncharacterised protein r2_g327 [Pycnogonum litorale]
MKVHLFGAVSSPACANWALRETARQCRAQFGDEVAETICSAFYVDDCLRSVSSISEAISLIDGLRRALKKGEFNLKKFTSNSREILEAIPKDLRAENLQIIDLDRDKLPIERALGVFWCIENDKLCFRITLEDRSATRRGILSVIASIYDPLGLVSPVLLAGRKILQELTLQRDLEWDDPIYPEIRHRWETWKAKLPMIESIEIERCIKPEDVGAKSIPQLHHFCDASTVGYGMASYVRILDANGKAHVSLVFAKSRVTPIQKVQTIPRLELTSAAVCAFNAFSRPVRTLL